MAGKSKILPSLLAENYYNVLLNYPPPEKHPKEKFIILSGRFYLAIWVSIVNLLIKTFGGSYEF
jgi:hypothetical protein